MVKGHRLCICTFKGLRFAAAFRRKGHGELSFLLITVSVAGIGRRRHAGYAGSVGYEAVHSASRWAPAEYGRREYCGSFRSGFRVKFTRASSGVMVAHLIPHAAGLDGIGRVDGHLVVRLVGIPCPGS